MTTDRARSAQDSVSKQSAGWARERSRVGYGKIDATLVRRMISADTCVTGDPDRRAW
jgi:hypothetical protein